MLSVAIGFEEKDLSDIELLTDRKILEDLSEGFRADGKIMVCHVCDDVSELVAGIVVMRSSEEAWVLCGPCLRKMPIQGPVAS